jgi:thioredoxin
MALSVVTDAQLKELRTQGKAVVADFYADWCHPCHALAPELEKLASAAEGEIEFVKIDIDAHPELTAELAIRGVPTVIHFGSDGDEVARSIGAARGEEIARRLGLTA